MSRAIVSEPDRGEHIEHQNNRVYTLSQRDPNMIDHCGGEMNTLSQRDSIREATLVVGEDPVCQKMDEIK